MAEIRKVKRIQKEIALNNSKEAFASSKRLHNFNNANGLFSKYFDEETGKLHVKNHSKK